MISIKLINKELPMFQEYNDIVLYSSQPLESTTKSETIVIGTVNTEYNNLFFIVFFLSFL